MTFNPDAKDFNSNTYTSTDAVKIECVPQKQNITVFKVKNIKAIFRLFGIQKQFLQETNATENNCFSFETIFLACKVNV